MSTLASNKKLRWKWKKLWIVCACKLHSSSWMRILCRMYWNTCTYWMAGFRCWCCCWLMSRLMDSHNSTNGSVIHPGMNYNRWPCTNWIWNDLLNLNRLDFFPSNLCSSAIHSRASFIPHFSIKCSFHVLTRISFFILIFRVAFRFLLLLCKWEALWIWTRAVWRQSLKWKCKVNNARQGP